MIQLYVSHLSPYACKIMALMGYAAVPHEIIVEDIWNRFAVLKKMTGKTMVPVLRHGDFAINDSTRIAKHLLASSQRPLLPDERFLAWLVEDFCDEWIVRWFARARWALPQNRRHMEKTIGAEMFGFPLRTLGGRVAAASIRASLEKSGTLTRYDGLENSRERTLALLEDLFEHGLYLFGGHPSVADFALYGFLWQFGHDPASQDAVRAFPNLWRYVQRVHAWSGAGGALDATVRPTAELSPLIAEILGTYWRVLEANARMSRGQTTDVELLDGTVLPVRSAGWYATCLNGLLDEAQSMHRTSGVYCLDPALDAVIGAAIDGVKA
ncbi:MAG: glutathione S-transferase family protein [bacterium]